jgi:hypothetical protein
MGHAVWADMMSHLSLHSLPVAALLCTLAAPVLAQDGEAGGAVSTEDRGLPEVPANSPAGRFGDEGQLAISSDAGLSLANTSLSGVEESTTTLVLRPALDWFFADSISFGGFVGVDYTSAPSGSTSVLSVGPRVGYNLPLGDRISVWPKVGLSIANTTLSEDDADGIGEDDDDDSNTSAQLNLFVPIAFHPVQHFFLGLGPALDVDLSGEQKATTIAARLTIGGWI